MKISNLNELVEAGIHIGVKVTPAVAENQPAVNIRDCQFTDFVRAVRYLQHIQSTEMPES